MTPKRGYRRGYPVAILLGLEEDSAVLWKVFSKVVKPLVGIQFKGNRKDPKALYNFHESIINAMRPTLKEGVRSVILASSARTTYAKDFVDHTSKHHSWMTQGPTKVAFAEVTGSAGNLSQVAALTRAPNFQKLISETTAKETESLIELLETRLSASNRSDAVLYSLVEAENLILTSKKKGKSKPEYLLLTDKYLVESRNKGRLNRLLQVAANENVKTRVITAESPAGKRLSQLGGFVCLTKREK